MTETTITSNRTCTQCSYEGTPDNFHRKFSVCKSCNESARKANRVACQKEQPSKSEEAKEKARAACRNWKAKYPDRYKAAQKKWYDRNSEAKSKYSREYSRERRKSDPTWRAEANRRSCESAKRRYKADPAVKAAITERCYKYNYGLSIEDVEAMHAAQKGQCALCQEKRKLVVDHDHNTGKVRSLLCYRCNQGLGCFADSTKRLQDAIDYLLKHDSD